MPGYTLDQLAERFQARRKQEKAQGLTAQDMLDIEEALAQQNVRFNSDIVKTEESSLDQVNDSTKRMMQGDVSKFNHLPGFLREYYGKKAMEEVFGPGGEFPPLSDELKSKLGEMTNRPEFRYTLTQMIERGATDKDGNDISDRLREYDRYMNSRMLAETLNPVSEERKENIRKKFPGAEGERLIAENQEKQVFLAKTMFMSQLGRMDIHNEDGSNEPYAGTTAELFGHSGRVAFTLPTGSKEQQTKMYDAWQKSALDSSVLRKGRFASHEMHRRQVDKDGNVVPFEEIRIRWKKQLTNLQFNKKITTYIGNYGMNISLGGLGKPFNGTDCVDAQGSFGHTYMRTRKGDEKHCGAILFGFENAVPKGTSCIGQLHNFKAISHDMSPFFSGKTTVGKTIGGREADLSHLSPEEFTEAMNTFEAGYRSLQERAQQDPEAAKQLEELNEAMCGKRMDAVQLKGLLTSFGMDKEKAVKLVDSARTEKDANYTKPFEREDTISPKGLREEYRKQAEGAKHRLLKDGSNRSENSRDRDIVTVLAGHALDNASLKDTATAEGLEEFWNKTTAFYSEHVKDFVKVMGRDEMQKLALSEDGGKELATSFRKYVAGLDHIPEQCPQTVRPKAGGRVEQLKERMKKEEFDTPEKKRSCLAELLGARKSVKAGRSHTLLINGNLLQPLGENLEKEVSSVREKLDGLSDEQVDRLFEMGKKRGYAGAMEEEFDALTISPAEREISRIKQDAVDLEIGSEEMENAAAELLWLESKKDLPFERQRELMESDAHEAELRELKNSPEFKQMLHNNNINDLYEMVRAQDNKELMEQMGEATREIAESPFSRLYDELKQDPAKLQQYQQTFSQLAQNDTLREKLDNSAAGRSFLKQLPEVQYQLGTLEDKQAFVENMEKLQAHAAFLRFNVKPEIFELFSKEIPQFSEAYDQLSVPERGTAGDYDLTLKSLIYSANNSFLGEIEQCLLRQSVLHEMVGDAPGWEQKPFTEEDIRELNNRFGKLQTELLRKNDGVTIDFYDGVSEERITHAMTKGGLASAAKQVRKVGEELDAGRKKDKKQSPREYLEELLTFPLKKELYKKASYNNDDIYPVADQILAARALAKDVEEHPEAFQTTESMEQTYEKYRKAYRDARKSADVPDNILEKGVLKKDEGKSLSQMFGKAVAGSTSETMHHLPAEHRPSAREQIEALQKKAKNKEFENDYYRNRGIAQIIAIRQGMKIKPGGDKKLDNTVTSKAFKETERIFEIINRMPEEEVRKLERKMRDGHGGKLVEEFEKLNTYERYIENAKASLANTIAPHPREVAQIMAAEFQAGNQKDGMKKTADLNAIQKIADVIEKEPAYAEMMKDPKTLELVKKGNTKELRNSLLAYKLQLDEAAKKKAAASQMQEEQPGPEKKEQEKKESEKKTGTVKKTEPEKGVPTGPAFR
jgi:hypothetical protein